MTKETKKDIDVQSEDIKTIISDALARILSLKTKKTYQEEVRFISSTIKNYIETSYVSNEEHEKQLLELGFTIINYLKEMKDKKKEDRYESLESTIKELEEIIGE